MVIRVPKLLWMLPTGKRAPVSLHNAANVSREPHRAAEDDLAKGLHGQPPNHPWFRLSLRLTDCSVLRNQAQGVIYIKLGLDPQHRGAHHVDYPMDTGSKPSLLALLY